MAETYSAELLSAYTLTGTENILQKLQVMQRLGSLLTISWGESRSRVASTIVRVCPEKGMIALDAVPGAEHARMLSADELSFSAVVNGADVRFKAERIQEATLNGKDVLAVPIPDALTWIQRRESYRVSVPRAPVVLCRIPLPNDEVGEFEVLNISLLGIALLDRSGRLDYWGRVGQLFCNCRLLIDGLRDESVSLEIRNKRNTTGSQMRRPSTRVGFAFRHVTRTFARNLQRYVAALERESRRATDE